MTTKRTKHPDEPKGRRRKNNPTTASPSEPGTSGSQGATEPEEPGSVVPAGGQPIFSQPQRSADPTSFTKAVTDKNQRGIAQLEPCPTSRGGVEPVLTLAQVLGSRGAAQVAAIEKTGQMVFHSVGDTGSVTGPTTQSLVADKMVSDFDEEDAADVPQFFFHLGDVVYYFGEATYYYDQFYEPYRDYPAPILAIAGNHDGVVYPAEESTTLEAFRANFCATSPIHTPDAGKLDRTAMIQPGVYFTFEAPFVRIFALYSNVLEDPGVISAQTGTKSANTVLDAKQTDFLTAALKRAKDFQGALIVAVHHPPFTGGSEHGGSPLMLADIDAACEAAGVWPHAIFSGHAHNYQRFTRTQNGRQQAFVVAGDGGHNPLSKIRKTLRTPYKISDEVTLNSVDSDDYGYLRVLVNETTMRIEYHPQRDGATTKTPDDMVTIDLAKYTLA